MMSCHSHTNRSQVSTRAQLRHLPDLTYDAQISICQNPSPPRQIAYESPEEGTSSAVGTAR